MHICDAGDKDFGLVYDPSNHTFSDYQPDGHI
jgi:hypothetical protein